MELIVLFGGPIFIFGPGFLAALIAWNKGYRPWFWFLAMGPIGLLWVLLTPAVSQATTPEERERWETRTDWTGGILSGFTLLPMFALPLMAVVFYALAARPAPMPTMPTQARPVMTSSPLQVNDRLEPETKAEKEEASSSP